MVRADAIYVTPSDNSSPSGSSLHPNLAALAASYDRIIAEMDARRLTPSAARARISALEARDDQGVRWSIDPDSGLFVRLTAFGDVEYDTPPATGVMTPTGFTYSSEIRDDDPRLNMKVTPTGPSSVPLGNAEILQPRGSLSTNAKLKNKVSKPFPVWILIIIALLIVIAVTVLFIIPMFTSSVPTPPPTPALSAPYFSLF